LAATVQSVRGGQREDDTPPSSMESGAVAEENPGASQACARKVRQSVRHDVDDNGYCAHHADIQLMRRTDDGDYWAIVRKKCPKCIKEDCPAMLGGETSSANDSASSSSVIVEGNSRTFTRRVRRLVRHDVDDNGHCAHHADIQLMRLKDDGDWAIVRKNCPECIKEDCPTVLGEQTLNAEESASSSNIDVTDLLEEADNNGSEILLHRPDRISISYWSPPGQRRYDDVVKRSRILSGIKFCDSATGAITIHDVQKVHDTTSTVLPESDCDIIPISQSFNVCALLEGSRHVSTYFDVGDVVEYACGVDCRQGRCEDLASEIITNSTNNNYGTRCTTSDSVAINNVDNTNERDGEGDATEFMVKKIQELSMNDFDTTVCVSTKPRDSIRLSQAIVIFSTKDAVMDSSPATNDNLSNDQDGSSILSIDNNCVDIGVVFSQQNDRLVIETVSKNKTGWFHSTGCAIREGDIVVGINEFITSTMSPEQATALIHGIVSSQTTSQLSITVISMSQTINTLTKWDVVRKSVVGAVGGTLAVSGAVLYFTPLHPVGHAMALGGVAVLGTEFEGPRNVIVGAKQRLSDRRLQWSEWRRSRKEVSSDSLRREESWSEEIQEDRPAQLSANNI
jgi:hypothetical protein